jgi:hypothetical protein
MYAVEFLVELFRIGPLVCEVLFCVLLCLCEQKPLREQSWFCRECHVSHASALEHASSCTSCACTVRLL